MDSSIYDFTELSNAQRFANSPHLVSSKIEFQLADFKLHSGIPQVTPEQITWNPDIALHAP